MADEPTEPSTTDVDITRAPTLPGLELPEYHGRKAVGMRTALNGAGNRITRAHEIGERVVLVVEARCKDAGHGETDDGLVYKEVLKVLDVFEIQGAPGTRLLSHVRASYREADDERLGRQPLPLEPEGTTHATAADGTVLTPAELAELRGDPAAALTDERLSPVVVVYSDGARELWPDDFDPGEAKPSAGARFEVDGPDGEDVTVYVKEVLNAGTGETLEEWTDQQEHDRLLALEQAAEAEEAEADEAVVKFYRLEMPDGSAIEVDAAKAPAAPTSSIPADHAAEAVRIMAITDDGSEMLVVKDELPGSALPAADLPPLPGEDDLPGAPLGAPPVVDDEGPDLEPTPEDYVLVDTDLDLVRLNLAKITDVAQARRMLEAEKRGRGRGLQTRKGATDAILRRIAELEKEPSA